MLKITFISHKTTNDNENKIASGWNDAPLSDLGRVQAKVTREYFLDRNFIIYFVQTNKDLMIQDYSHSKNITLPLLWIGDYANVIMVI